MSIPFHICGIEDRDEFLEAARRHSARMGRLTTAAIIVGMVGALLMAALAMLTHRGDETRALRQRPSPREVSREE